MLIFFFVDFRNNFFFLIFCFYGALDNFSLSECMSFVNRTSLAPSIDNILVRCRANNRQVYINGYPLMPERKEIRQRLNMWKKYDEHRKENKFKAPSVLMLGIDSISRVNLVRAMPRTAQYLYDNEWFEMSGFNKVSPRLLKISNIFF